jgi:LL-diaminopimelate aminotransferase
LEEFDAYLGTAMNVILTRMKDEGKDVINLGLGDPDVQPPDDQRQALADACMDVDHHHYPSFYSPMPLKEAIAGWYQRHFDVQCDPETEVLTLLGSADGLFHIHTCLLDHGEIALVPDPCYPAYVAGVKIAGGVIETVPLKKENGFMPDLDAIPPQVAEKAKMIWVNYPNNPTAAVATGDFYKKLIQWAHQYNVAVISDNPYSEVCFEDYRAPSFLQFEGAKEVGIEFNSLWPKSNRIPTGECFIRSRWPPPMRSTAPPTLWPSATACTRNAGTYLSMVCSTWAWICRFPRPPFMSGLIFPKALKTPRNSVLRYWMKLRCG